TVLMNGRALSGLFVSALTYLLSYLHHRYDTTASRKIDVAVGLVTAKLLHFAVAASEIAAFWARHVPPPFEPGARIAIAALLAGTAIIWLGLGRKEEWV